MESATKALIEGYIQKAEKKMDVAEKLLKSSDYEDAVSRAYYAVYHATQALLLTEGEKAETHKGVVTLFGLLFVKTGKFDKKMGTIKRGQATFSHPFGRNDNKMDCNTVSSRR